MVGSVGSSADSLAIMASYMQASATSQDVSIAVLKKAQDVEQAQGEAALKLIDSASASGKIDVYA
ncbi:MAG: YjfB family protein [Methylobacter sp.]